MGFSPEFVAALERMIRVGRQYGHTQEAAEALAEAWEREKTRVVVAERFAGVIDLQSHDH